MFCPTCGTRLADQTPDVCPVCEEQLAVWGKPREIDHVSDQPNYCVACGGWLPRTASSCPTCGHAIGAPAPHAQAPEQGWDARTRLTPVVQIPPHAQQTLPVSDPTWSTSQTQDLSTASDDPRTQRPPIDIVSGWANEPSRQATAATPQRSRRGLGILLASLAALALAAIVVLPRLAAPTGGGSVGQKDQTQAERTPEDQPEQETSEDQPEQDAPGEDSKTPGENAPVESGSVYGAPGSVAVADSTVTANMLVNTDADLSDGVLYYKLFRKTEEPVSIARRDADGRCWVIYTAPEGSQIVRLQATQGKVYFSYSASVSAKDFSTATIACMNADGSNVHDLVTTSYDPSENLRFYIARNRLYYPKNGSLFTAELDGTGEQEVTSLNNLRAWFVAHETIYLVDDKSFYRLEEDGSRTTIYTCDSWATFTATNSYLVVMHGGSGQPRTFTWISFDDFGSGVLAEWRLDDVYPGEKVTGLGAYGDDLIIDTVAEGAKFASLYRVSPDTSSQVIWQGANYEYVARPTVLGDRVYFSVYATESSIPAECSTSVDADLNWHIEDTINSYPELTQY